MFAKLVEKGHIDDEKFARYWLENRNQRKGSSLRKLKAELMQKGVASDIIEAATSESDRTDSDELAKIIAKKRSKYPDEEKLKAYLARQGFRYDDITEALLVAPRKNRPTEQLAVTCGTDLCNCQVLFHGYALVLQLLPL